LKYNNSYNNIHCINSEEEGYSYFHQQLNQKQQLAKGLIIIIIIIII